MLSGTHQATNPSRFLFVDYATDDHGHLELKPGARKKARVAVMRYHMQQHSISSKPSRDHGPPQISLTKSKSRFRLTSPKARHPRNAKPVRHIKNPPKDALNEAMTVRPAHALTPALALIEDPSPATRELFDYYMKYYWTNSLAVNPGGRWTTLTLANPAMTHAKLSLVAVHRADRRGVGVLSTEHLYHRGKAMQLLNTYLSSDAGHQNQSTLGAMALLATLDDHSPWAQGSKNAHMAAVASLVRAHGGLDSPRISDPLRRVLVWVDLLHAVLVEGRPLLGMSELLTTNLQEDVTSVLGERQPLAGTQQIRASWGGLGDVLEQLRLLIDLKLRLETHRAETQMRRAYSSRLWKLEYDVLNWDIGAVPDLWGEGAVIKAFQYAVIICSWTKLREQNSLFLYGILLERLQHNLSSILEEARSNSAWLSDEMLPLLLWMLSMGWKAAAHAHRSGRWFSVRMVVCLVRSGVQLDSLPLLALDRALQHSMLQVGLYIEELAQLLDEVRQWIGLIDSSQPGSEFD